MNVAGGDTLSYYIEPDDDHDVITVTPTGAREEDTSDAAIEEMPAEADDAVEMDVSFE